MRSTGPSSIEQKFSTLKSDCALALDLAVRDFWPSVPDGWVDFCLYRELHEDFKTRADCCGPQELILEATQAWKIEERVDGDRNPCLVLENYVGTPFSQPVSLCSSLRRLKRLRVVGRSTHLVERLAAALPLLLALTHVEAEESDVAQKVYRDVLGSAKLARMHDGCLFWTIRAAFRSADAAEWLRCLPRPTELSTNDESEAVTRTTIGGDETTGSMFILHAEASNLSAASDREQTPLPLSDRVSIARKVVMARLFPCESDSAESEHPLLAAATQDRSWLGYLLSIGFAQDVAAVQRLFQDTCDEPRGDAASSLQLLCDAGADVNDPTALRLALDPTSRPALRWLLARGVDVNARLADPTGPSIRPLHFAAYNADAELIAMLLGAGADPRVRDDMGKLPEEYCAHEMQGGIDDRALVAALHERAREMEAEEAAGRRRGGSGAAEGRQPA